MAEILTPQQRQAVYDRGGKLLVSAAAGSGKTKVLVDRLMSYLTDPNDPANIDDFLIITYTKAAAAELRGKIASKLSQQIALDPENRHLQHQLQRLYLTKISTVHAFCGDILREYAYRLDIPGDFRVADENECAEIRMAVVNKLLDQAYEESAADADFCAFIDTQGLGRDDRQVPQIVLKVYDSARCHLNPDAWLDHCQSQVSAEKVSDASQTVFGGYLMARLQQWLDAQIEILEHCVAVASGEEGFEKPCVLLLDTIGQLRLLRQCQSWDEVIHQKNIDFGLLRFPKTCSNEILIQQIKAAREACKKGLAKQLRPFSDDSERILSDLRGCSQAVNGLMRLVKAFGCAYDKAKRSRRILDFGDLEHYTLDLLLGKSRTNLSSAAVEIGKRYKEIMVDEYQDSNEVQDAIYGAVAGRNNNLFMVGDVKQSIYQFRLADPGIFLEKYANFVPADDARPGDGRKVVLSRNFRSSAGVLAAANDVFATCMSPDVGGLHYGKQEALYEGIPHVSLGVPETELICVDVQQDTYAEEAAVVAERIRRMLDDGEPVRQGDSLRPVRPEDIVILLRSPGSCGRDYQLALEKLGIRCTTGGGEDLLQTEEVAFFRSFLQTIYNPRLDIPLVATLASPVFSFTADDLAVIRAGNRGICFYDSLIRSELPKCKDFLSILRQLRAINRRESLTGLLRQILLLTRMEDIYAAMDGAQTRVAHLQTFFTLAAEAEAAGNGNLGRFLEYLDNLSDKGLLLSGEQSASGAVTIMSIHKSKGLEFPVVFLCALGREFNMESQRANVLCHKDLGLGLSAVDTQKRLRYPSIAKRAIAAQIGAESISEEMRVLYVAMTRPKDRIIMTYASQRLEKDIQEMVDRISLGGKQLLIKEAVCPGEWILLTALQRTEAGALFALSGYPTATVPGDPPWKIYVTQAPQLEACVASREAQSSLPPLLLQTLQEQLSFHYPHMAATQAPSKQTATQLKGRIKDQEVSQDAQPPRKPVRTWRKPGFAPKEQGGKEFGNAIHAVMQYADYSRCTTLEQVRQEIARLLEQGYLSQAHADMVSPEMILEFFSSELGRRLRHGHVEREFKFSILEDGGVYDPALAGEKVLLQGVVDCILVEEDSITIIDYKTDHVTEDTISAVAERYRPQVQSYAEAMCKVFAKPVREAMLYFFHMSRFVNV